MGDLVKLDAQIWERLMVRLDEQIPELVDDFMTEFTSRGLYAPDAVSVDDLRQTAAETLRMLIARVAGHPTATEEAKRAAVLLGERRARQGVPLEALTEAVRIDLLLMWRKLRELAGADHVALLADRFELMLSVLDEHVFYVQSSFLREQAALQRDSRLAAERELSRLFNAQHPSAALLDRVAATTGVAVDAALDLVAFEGEQAGRAAAIAGKAAPSGRMYVYPYRDITCVFWADDGRGRDRSADFEHLPGVRLRAAGLAALPRATRSAHELLSVARGLDHLSDLDSLWPAVAAARLGELAPAFTSRLLSELDDLGAYEHGRVIATVRAYLASGSVKAAAAAVYCHRNTVVNRLATFRGRTGLDVTIPAQAALAYVALSAYPT